ncbi:hypothetical protein RP726_06455 [Candidatus Methylospira mobilis]|uniref:hypothetical protein n=1 Tax=Candidatus Methylospira mobilis TaxID=1808979 RepID=UPI0028ECD0CC|nr:hypothetical protein [Candidatus Methylospira mobilis]WNV06055.1 hypothetical protein RP726_06455 [Candidatus Methylospira mobilis]
MLKTQQFGYMKVCIHNGLLIAVLTRNEHCPPHVHVGANEWEARFEFSFWHNGVRLLDVLPVQNKPTVAVLENLRQTIKQPSHLRRAREIWWRNLQTVCLINQLWDTEASEVASAKNRQSSASIIKDARFDAGAYKTVLQLEGQSNFMEIRL